DDRRAAVIGSLVDFFGPRAAEPMEYVDLDWSDEEWTRGCYGAFFPPGVWTHYGRAVRAPIGRINWAGAETATIWAGYMDGAVQSGERAAAAALSGSQTSERRVQGRSRLGPVRDVVAEIQVEARLYRVAVWLGRVGATDAGVGDEVVEAVVDVLVERPPDARERVPFHPVHGGIVQRRGLELLHQRATRRDVGLDPVSGDDPRARSRLAHVQPDHVSRRPERDKHDTGDHERG